MDALLSPEQRKKTAAYMRINHAGEIAAQGLYHGQMFAARNDRLRAELQHAAKEEIDHLLWCKQRLKELEGHPSFFDPLWYVLSFKLGFLAGVLSDRLSLGLIAAVEQQVYRHLQEHITHIAVTDKKTRAILQQMQQDELQHRQHALDAGGFVFSATLQEWMFLSSRVMTKISYYL